MTNAKKEFIKHIENKEILCAIISFSVYVEENEANINLPSNYTTEQYEAFLDNIDVDYDSGFGGQELYGIIWYKDGTWSSRGEYDGSEWWKYNSCPTIPEELL